eukprot:m.807717 g.807717  ORF g.807717 m.807717 type:complete len:975 (-) comp59306_c0_seq2:106-3030(-)
MLPRPARQLLAAVLCAALACAQTLSYEPVPGEFAFNIPIDPEVEDRVLVLKPSTERILAEITDFESEYIPDLKAQLRSYINLTAVTVIAVPANETSLYLPVCREHLGGPPCAAVNEPLLVCLTADTTCEPTLAQTFEFQPAFVSNLETNATSTTANISWRRSPQFGGYAPQYTLTLRVHVRGNGGNLSALSASPIDFQETVETQTLSASSSSQSFFAIFGKASPLAPFTVYQLLVEASVAGFSESTTVLFSTQRQLSATPKPDSFGRYATEIVVRLGYDTALVDDLLRFDVNLKDISDGEASQNVSLSPIPDQSSDSPTGYFASLVDQTTQLPLVVGWIKNLPPRTDFSLELTPHYKLLGAGQPSPLVNLSTSATIGSAMGPVVAALINSSASVSFYNVSWEVPRRPVGVNTSYELAVDSTVLVIVGFSSTWEVVALRDYVASLRIRQTTEVGPGPWSASTRIQRTSTVATSSRVTLLVVLTMVIAAFALLFIILYERRRRNKLFYSKLHLPVADEWEIDPSKLDATEEIGAGLFGVVYRGTVELPNGSVVDVAIKECREGSELRDKQLFIEEAQVNKHVCAEPHPNIIRLIGVCMQAQPLRIMLEFAHFGDLRSYVQRQHFSPATLPGAPLSIRDRARIVSEILAGMDWIAAHDIVHRDLAARNILLDRHRTAKLSDFGLSKAIARDDYYRTSSVERPLPVRWMSPECLYHGVNTSAGDVWASGIVIWEIFNHGAVPFSQFDDSVVADRVLAGARLLQPESCPQQVWQLANECWKGLRERPDFAFLRQMANKILQQMPEDLDLSSTYSVLDTVASEDHSHDSSFGSNEPPKVSPYSRLVAPGQDGAGSSSTRSSDHGIRSETPDSPQASHSPMSSRRSDTGSLPTVSPYSILAVPGQPTLGVPPVVRPYHLSVVRPQTTESSTFTSAASPSSSSLSRQSPMLELPDPAEHLTHDPTISGAPAESSLQSQEYDV